MDSSLPPVPILLSRIGQTRVGFPGSAVHEIVRAVAIAPASGAPDIIEGAINLHGRVIPVVDVRRRLGLLPAPLTPEQFLIVLQSGERLITVRVDDVEDMIDVSAASLESPVELSPVLSRLSGVAATGSGALMIYDVDAFLTQAEQDALEPITLVGT